MNRSTLSRVLFVVLLTALLTTTGLAATAQEREALLCSGLNHSIGLVMDGRGYLYTAEQSTGMVYCLPPGDEPVFFAQVPGTPTSLTVDRLRNVFVGTESGAVYLISLDGSVIETYRCPTAPMGLDVDRDGNIVIATAKGNIIRVERGSLLNKR